MPLEVEHTDEFGEWWHDLAANQQDAEFPDGEVTITNFSRLGENDDNCEGGN